MDLLAIYNELDIKSQIDVLNDVIPEVLQETLNKPNYKEEVEIKMSGLLYIFISIVIIFYFFY